MMGVPLTSAWSIQPVRPTRNGKIDVPMSAFHDVVTIPDSLTTTTNPFATGRQELL